jgi:hypothetical protein
MMVFWLLIASSESLLILMPKVGGHLKVSKIKKVS